MKGLRLNLDDVKSASHVNRPRSVRAVCQGLFVFSRRLVEVGLAEIFPTLNIRPKVSECAGMKGLKGLREEHSGSDIALRIMCS